MYNNMCQATCPVNTYIEKSLSKCIDCVAPCATCTGPSNGKCLSCIISSNTAYNFLSGTTCVTGCESGTIPINFVCQTCTSPCLTCTIN